MGILQNGYRHNLTGKIYGSTNVDGWHPAVGVYQGHRAAANRNIFAGEAITDDLVSVPSGNRPPQVWIMARKSGGMSSHSEARGTTTATLSLASGINLSGLSEGVADALATLQLVVSMQGTSAGSCTVTGNILAALGMSGSAAGVATHSATINALAWGVGTAAGTSTATLTSYATGRLVGTTEESGLTVAGITNSVWNALLSNYTVSGSAGNTLSLAGSGGVDYNTLAAAILTAAQANPIHSNVKEVNDLTVTGTGVEGDTWGPA